MEFNLLSAIDIAKKAHDGQVRKYTNEPYLSHPFSVAGLVASVSNDIDMVVAAILHDIVEDTHVNIDTVKHIFGETVAGLVADLTDVSKHSDGNRKARKGIDRDHTSKATPDAKTIKLADLIDNTKSITQFDPDFAKVYMAEKKLLLEVLREGDSTLFTIAYDLVDGYFKEKKETP